MRFRRFVIRGLLYGPYLFHKITGTGPFGPGGAVYLQEPSRQDGQALKAALFRHYVKQYHEASCSVASVVMAVNAIREVQVGRSQPITQMDILQKVRTGYWKERMSAEGHNGRRGLPLPLLGEIVKSSLDIYGVAYKTIETVPGAQGAGPAERKREELRDRLTDFETKGDSLIIAHFGQGAFVKTLNIPHISPVGGFDTQSGQVIILDVDPDQANPYRVPFDTFCKGLFSSYNPILRLFGYRTGGYVFIKLT
ncbi:MAG: phytochelatin synthase family protein [Desulfobacterales bacterium]|nr:phytochelatin synthase family protein [Desulfobacterales bacterium]